MTLPAPRAVALPPSFRSLTMARGVRAAMQREPCKVAITHGERRRSYAELAARIERITRATVALGLRRGENAAIVARNGIEYLELACGVPEAGVALATVNPRYTSAEIESVCDDAEARVVFTDAATAPLVRTARFATVRRIIEIGPQFEDWLAAAPQAVELPLVDEWDTWTIPYTSGTTGKPKGVLISHRSRALVALGSAMDYGCFSPDDTFLAMAPMNHGGGLAYPIACLLHGGSVEIMERFDAELVLQKFKHGGITGVFMVPTHFHQIFALPPAVLERYRAPPLRTIIANAAPLPQAMKAKIVPYFGADVLFEVYSSTEAGMVCSLRPRDQLRKLSCVGTPQAHTEVKILDEAGRECAPDEVGELFSRSPYLFHGYWKRPEETAAAFRDGWVSVGDLARRDAEGYLYIVDRKKDMVISGGVNIYPREIEEVLLAHPALADVAVIGVPDEKWGERLRTFAVLRPGGTLSVEQMVEFCTPRLAGYKIPRELRFIDALPRNANGKVLKTELRKLG
jgi:acyl-CoA synthetase (AMP-forming)/AMP-acid ligase II